jgi:hypothetical protein
MAKAERPELEELRQGKAAGLLRKVFTESSRYAGELKLSPGESLGVTSRKALELELEIDGVSPKEERRKIATLATGGMRRGFYDSIFNNFSTKIQTAKPGETEIYYQSGLESANAAFNRYEHYEALLLQEVERLRAEKAEQKRREDEVKRARAALPPKSVLEIYAPYNQSDVTKRLISLDQDTPEGVIVTAANFEQGHFVDPGDSLLHRMDVKRILKRGLNPEELKGLLPKLRAGIVDTTERVEMFAAEAARGILRLTDSFFDSNPDQKYIILAYSKRTLAPFLSAEIGNINTNPNLFLRANIPQPYDNFPTSYPAELMLRWGLRYSKEVAGEFAKVLQESSDELGDRLQSLLENEKAEQLLEDLRNNKEAVLNGRTIHPDEIKGKLSKQLLPDAVLLKAVMADVIGEVLPMAYLFDDQRRDIGFESLRKLANQFSLEEIRGILETQVNVDITDLRARIKELERQMQLKDRQEKEVPKRERKALRKERNQIVQEKDNLAEQAKAFRSVRTSFISGLTQKLEQETGTEVAQAFHFVNPSGWEKDNIPHTQIVTATEKLSSLVPDELLTD